MNIQEIVFEKMLSQTLALRDEMIEQLYQTNQSLGQENSALRSENIKLKSDLEIKKQAESEMGSFVDEALGKQ